jgi:two-component system sensor kinase FixL
MPSPSLYTTKSEGLGMGLAIVRTIVNAHGGAVGAENNPHGGASFRFTLPVASERER